MKTEKEPTRFTVVVQYITNTDEVYVVIEDQQSGAILCLDPEEARGLVVDLQTAILAVNNL